MFWIIIQNDRKKLIRISSYLCACDNFITKYQQRSEPRPPKTASCIVPCISTFLLFHKARYNVSINQVR